MSLDQEFKARRLAQQALTTDGKQYDREELIGILETEMLAAADALEFEKAAKLRDQIAELKEAPDLPKGNLSVKKRTKVKKRM